MKKVLFILALIAIGFTSCKEDEDTVSLPEEIKMTISVYSLDNSNLKENVAIAVYNSVQDLKKQTNAIATGTTNVEGEFTVNKGLEKNKTYYVAAKKDCYSNYFDIMVTGDEKNYKVQEGEEGNYSITCSLSENRTISIDNNTDKTFEINYSYKLGDKSILKPIKTLKPNDILMVEYVQKVLVDKTNVVAIDVITDDKETLTWDLITESCGEITDIVLE